MERNSMTADLKSVFIRSQRSPLKKVLTVNIDIIIKPI